MKTDKYYIVYNCEDNYKEIADEIRGGGQCIFAWTDKLGTQFDILMSTQPQHLCGVLQGGVNADDLFVSIMRLGAFGFEINDYERHPLYISEKLNVSSIATSEKLSELINGVIKHLNEEEDKTN